MNLHKRRQAPRVGIDGIAEEQQLHDRYRDHRRERHAVAPHLNKLLVEDRHEPARRERHRSSLRACEVVGGTLHQMDEHLLQTGRLLRPLPCGVFKQGFEGLAQRRAVGAGDVQRRAEAGDLLHSGQVSELLFEFGEIRTLDAPGMQQIFKAGKRAKDIVQQILSFSRPEKSNFKILNLIAFVIEIEDKYSDEYFTEFWYRYSVLYNSLTGTTELIDDVEVYFDNRIGIVAPPEEEAKPKGKSNDNESSGKPGKQ